MPDTNTTDTITAKRARVADISHVIAQSRRRVQPGILDHLQDTARTSPTGQATRCAARCGRS